MRYRLYTIYDRLAEEAAPLYQQKTDLAAYRLFQQSIAKAPDAEHYQLVCLGFYDTETMRIEALDPRVISPVKIAEELQKMELETDEPKFKEVEG